MIKKLIKRTLKLTFLEGKKTEVKVKNSDNDPNVVVIEYREPKNMGVILVSTPNRDKLKPLTISKFKPDKFNVSYYDLQANKHVVYMENGKVIENSTLKEEGKFMKFLKQNWKSILFFGTTLIVCPPVCKLGVILFYCIYRMIRKPSLISIVMGLCSLYALVGGYAVDAIKNLLF